MAIGGGFDDLLYGWVIVLHELHQGGDGVGSGSHSRMALIADKLCASIHRIPCSVVAARVSNSC